MGRTEKIKNKKNKKKIKKIKKKPRPNLTQG